MLHTTRWIVVDAKAYRTRSGEGESAVEKTRHTHRVSDEIQREATATHRFPSTNLSTDLELSDLELSGAGE